MGKTKITPCPLKRGRDHRKLYSISTHLPDRRWGVITGVSCLDLSIEIGQGAHRRTHRGTQRHLRSLSGRSRRMTLTQQALSRKPSSTETFWGLSLSRRTRYTDLAGRRVSGDGPAQQSQMVIPGNIVQDRMQAIRSKSRRGSADDLEPLQRRLMQTGGDTHTTSTPIAGRLRLE